MIDERLIREKFKQMNPSLNERARRHWVAIEAKALGRGGISAVSRATGITRKTIRAGLSELKNKNVDYT
ncbi:ISAzo13 family transposase, partial [Candidatus Micrarchaeota archaeon]|nr:ISAzo13 family transposase [Candidatus Micrarchaeota archaeon]